MKNPGGYIGEALVSCGAIKPKKRVTAFVAAEKYALASGKYWNKFGVERFDGWRIAKAAFQDGVAWQKRQAKREGKS